MVSSVSLLIIEAILVAAAFVAAAGVSYFVIAQARRKTPATWQEMEARFDRQQARLDAQAKRIDQLEAEIDDLREGRVIDHEEMRELRDGIGLLVEQIRKANMTPVWTPENVKRRPRTGQTALARQIEQLFTLDEIDGLAFDMGIDKGQLSGDTLGPRARALVAFAADRGRLNELRRAVTDARPGMIE